MYVAQYINEIIQICMNWVFFNVYGAHRSSLHQKHGMNLEEDKAKHQDRVTAY